MGVQAWTRLDIPLPSYAGRLQRATVILACSNLLGHIRLDARHSSLLQFVDDVYGVEAVALPRIIFIRHSRSGTTFGKAALNTETYTFTLDVHEAPCASTSARREGSRTIALQIGRMFGSYEPDAKLVSWLSDAGVLDGHRANMPDVRGYMRMVTPADFRF